MPTKYITNKFRTLLVQFTCGRCGTTATVPYEHSPDYSVESNMNSQRVPAGWRVEAGGIPLLCPTCHTKLTEFLNGGKTNDVQ